MEPHIIRTAKEIPGRLKQVLYDLFDASEPALKASVAGLRTSLGRIDSYLQSIEKEHFGSPAVAASMGTKAAAPAAKAPGKKSRRRRRKGSPSVSDIVLAELGKHPKGLRPFELAGFVAEATGMDKARATGNTTTALYRGKKLGLIASKNGIYTAVAGGNISGGQKPEKAGKKK